MGERRFEDNCRWDSIDRIAGCRYGDFRWIV
jgi:hypothetical protein